MKPPVPPIGAVSDAELTRRINALITAGSIPIANSSSLANKVDKTQTINNIPLTANIILSKADISGLENINNTSDLAKPVSSATQAALNLKENLSNKNQANGYAGLDGAGRVPAGLLNVSGLAYLGVWNANTNSPTITSSVGPGSGSYYRVSVAGSTIVGGISSWALGDWIIFNGQFWDKIDNTDSVQSVNSRIGSIVLTNADVNLGNVDNTSDAAKPISTSTQTALNAKVDKTTTINGASLATNITLVKADVGLANVDNTSDAAKPISTATQTALTAKVDKTTTINTYALSSNITLVKSDVGLGNIDNTADLVKPVSTATQTAFNLKVDKTTTINSFALSGNISLGKGDVGLGNVDNTSDANKPVSTATQTALNLKETSSNKNQANGYAGLDVSTKIPNNLLNITWLTFQGTWNALTNSPTLVSSTGPSAGSYYRVTTTGYTLLNGVSRWNVGDVILFTGGTWIRLYGGTSCEESYPARYNTNYSLDRYSNFINNFTTLHGNAFIQYGLTLPLVGTNYLLDGYSGMAFSPNQNRIYLAPYNQATASSWHYIDCTTNTMVEYTPGVTAT